MAEDNGGNGHNLNYFGHKNKNKESETEDTGDEAEEPSLDLDIGLGNSNQAKFRNIGGAEGSPNAACSNESSRREDISFSLKHFLNRDTSYGGARPKVYPTPTPPPSPSPRLMASSEVTSGLPDFVQDHLVIEQCYLNSGSPQQHLAVDLDSIPNFPEFPDHNYAAGQDLPFDLTARPDLGQQQEVGTSKSLPDFLSDGPIRNERGQPTPSPSISPERRPASFQIENDRLRRELDVLRRQLSDHIVRNERLETELNLLRDRSGLEGLIEQLEESVRRFRKRADEAEVRASKLKAENNALRCELEIFRSGARGRGGDNSAASSSAQQTDNERLASQLRNAANTAELSLRHLLIGVDNLRLLAASLETQPQQPLGRKLSSSDDSQDDEPGPAL